jgi:hypothetical protein
MKYCCLQVIDFIQILFCLKFMIHMTSFVDELEKKTSTMLWKWCFIVKDNVCKNSSLNSDIFTKPFDIMTIVLF